MLKVRLQFKLRTALTLTAIFAALFAIVIPRYRQAQRLARSVERLSAAGQGSIYFQDPDKYGWSSEQRSRYTPDSMWGYLFAEIHTVALIDVSDGDMAALQGCLEDLPNLRGIWIFNRGGYVLLTDSGLGHLSELVTLQRLELEIAGPNKITGGGLRRLHKLKELRELYLKNSVVVNADLDALQAFPKLEFLSLSGTNIDDSGLKMLDGRTTLQFLNIENTQVTRDGVAAFRLAHPNCSVAR